MMMIMMLMIMIVGSDHARYYYFKTYFAKIIRLSTTALSNLTLPKNVYSHRQVA